MRCALQQLVGCVLSLATMAAANRARFSDSAAQEAVLAITPRRNGTGATD